MLHAKQCILKYSNYYACYKTYGDVEQCTVVGENLCARRPLELKGSERWEGVADKETYTAHTSNIISEGQ
jgi:hypothetical protein